ncbi:hypothetical protein SETIT_2G124500v2 [Setaria italica]|uniref:Protein FAR1-RELATED SEQUENCE n=1 Tax=Setaria italica TaxID=4555 RepID=A0A368PXZ9_SETIT|nr:hypothetical protein SETIT_2G124500v2 [Setaria italica]
MREAIKIVFDKSQHRNCRWHITRVWEYEVDQLYTQHKDKNLKERLESLINYPLGPTQFEVEWKKLVDECGIVDNPAIIALREKRKSWITTYFKGITTLHMFAKRVLDSLQHTDHMDVGETHYSHAEVIQACKSRFDEQLSRVYMRVVYQEYKKQYGNNTTFVIEPNLDLEVRNGYLVTHEKGTGSFCWVRHVFRGRASGELEAVGAIQNVGAAASTLECSVAVVESDEPELESNLDPTSTNYLAGISLAEPPVSRTKGRKPGMESQSAKEAVNSYSTYTRSYGSTYTLATIAQHAR